MTKICSVLFIYLVFLQTALGQSADSIIPKKDSVGPGQKTLLKRDTSSGIANNDSLSPAKDTSQPQEKDTIVKATAPTPALPALFVFRDALRKNDWFNFMGKPKPDPIQEHKSTADDGIFYLLVGIVFYFSLIRIFFSKYFDYLVSLFLRASLRQQQIREQLLQAPLPSLLLNILFVINAGFYICFLVNYYGTRTGIGFWILGIDACLLIGLIYLAKFLILKTAGWIFDISRATDIYIFIVYMVNKILGIFMLPILVVIAFSAPFVRDVAVTVSYCLVILLFLYRFIASYPSVRNEIKISILYFFLYLCAFEIAPLLLIYKVLLTYLEKAS